MSARFSIVVPTLGRPSLGQLLDSLATSSGPLPDQLVLVDDRTEPSPKLTVPPQLASLTTVIRAGRGPAAARNAGWRKVVAHQLHTGVAEDDGVSRWVAFVDDDVVVGGGWLADLAADLDQAGERVGGVQGSVTVPLPVDRAPTDWERGTAGLQTARWITADMAYRVDALLEVGGFDERFPRAFREDADLALRVRSAGWQLQRGTRSVTHPVRPSDDWASLRQQAGNADDALMRRLHGPRWREQAESSRGRRSEHVAVTTAAMTVFASAAAGKRRLAAAAALSWLAGTARFAWSRIAPGPRDRAELRRMLLTSVAIPPAATWHWLRGTWVHRRAEPWQRPARAVLFDRDGTLIEDVPYNGNPDQVTPMPGAIDVVRELRRRGVAVGVITNQSGIGRGRLTEDEVRRVNDRVEQLFGAFDVWLMCPHAPEDGCRCRKPAPGMVTEAAARLGLPPESVVVVGDIGADIQAATAAGARGVLVPTNGTRRSEVEEAPMVAADLAGAVRLALGVPA
jgi:HAD superfamily hydrolase (TIGR01662 family)